MLRRVTRAAAENASRCRLCLSLPFHLILFAGLCSTTPILPHPGAPWKYSATDLSVSSFYAMMKCWCALKTPDRENCAFATDLNLGRPSVEYHSLRRAAEMRFAVAGGAVERRACWARGVRTSGGTNRFVRQLLVRHDHSRAALPHKWVPWACRISVGTWADPEASLQAEVTSKAAKR